MAETALRLLLGVTGSVHVVELPRYLQMFRQELGAEITVVMTRAATGLLPAGTVAAYAGGAVHTDMWGQAEPGLHITLPERADLFLVLPATANILAKAAQGIADDLLSTMITAGAGPVVFGPAMNRRMYESPAVQRNLATLRADGHVLMPGRETLAVANNASAEGVAPAPHCVVPFLREILASGRAGVRRGRAPEGGARHNGGTAPV